MTTLQSLRTMSVSELRYFLNERKIPHRDCIEKIELLFRAQQSLEGEEENVGGGLGYAAETKGSAKVEEEEEEE